MIIIASYSNVSVTYTANGTQTVFSFPFDYLRKAFVFVEADGTALEQGTNFSVSGKTVVFTTAPTAGTKLRIFRETETIPLVSWADASVLKAKDMTIQQVQVLHILEEYKGQYNEDLANMLVIAGVVTDSGELQHIVDQLNLIDANAAAALESENSAIASATAAANSATEATTAETALVNFLATKETLTAPAVDTTLTVTGAAADAKVTGDTIKSTQAEMSMFGVEDLLWDNYTLASKTQAGVTWTVDKTNRSIALTGTATGISVLSFGSSTQAMPSWFEKGKTYILHVNAENKVRLEVWVRKTGESSGSLYMYTDTVANLFITDDFEGIGFRFYVSTGTATNITIKPFISIYSTLDNLLRNNVVDLLSLSATYRNSTSNGITYTWNSENTQCTVAGTTTGNASFNVIRDVQALPTQLIAGKKYYLDFASTDHNVHFRAIFLDANNAESYKDYYNSGWLDIPANAVKVGFRLHIIGEDRTVNGTVTSCRILNVKNNTALQEQLEASTDKAVMELYTEFEWLNGRNTYTGGVTNSGYRTDKKRIRPNTTYYIGWNSSPDSLRCAFFDENENFIGVNYEEDLTQVDYRKPDGTGTFSGTYVNIFSFQSPADAHYVSMNSSRIDNIDYRTYISSKPVFALQGTGNFRILENDAIYQKYKDRKMCMFGTSFLMTDRLQRTGNFNNDGTDTTNFVIGVPEYLLPWWDTCDVYGYSSAPMMPGTSSSVRSIYDRIVTDQLDVSGYDDFIITRSTGGVTDDNIGSLADAEDMGNVNTYVGALRRIIDYIYTQNPNAHIWLQTNVSRVQFGNTSLTERYKLLNQAIKDTAELLFLPVIDCEKEGFNYYNAPLWCYDTGGHLNHYGAKNVGQFFRKQILGF